MIPIVALQDALSAAKRILRQEKFGDPVANAEIRGARRVLLQSMGIGALNAMHASRVFGLGAAEEPRSRPGAGRDKVGHFQSVKMAVLGVGDFGLAAEPNVPHGDTMGRVDVRPDHERTMLIEHLVRLKDIRRRADLAASEPVLGNPERQQQVLHHPDRYGRIKDGENVEPECRGELESRQRPGFGSSVAGTRPAAPPRSG